MLSPWSVYSSENLNDVVKEYVTQGSSAGMLHQSMGREMIASYLVDQDISSLWIDLLSDALKGKVRHTMANALASTAVAYIWGVSLAKIKQGLQTFTTNFYRSLVRLSLFDEYRLPVLVGYGHNAAAFAAIREPMTHLRPGHRRVIGVLSVSGDQRGVDIRQSTAVACTMFDLFIVKEDDRLGGWAVGETVALMYENALCYPYASRMHCYSSRRA